MKESRPIIFCELIIDFFLDADLSLETPRVSRIGLRFLDFLRPMRGDSGVDFFRKRDLDLMVFLLERILPVTERRGALKSETRPRSSRIWLASCSKRLSSGCVNLD